jgi:hypothetical protein
MTVSPHLQGLPIHCSHEAWEREHPEDLEHAIGVAHAAERTGRPAGRKFPCRGLIREFPLDRDYMGLSCDSCIFETTVKRTRTQHPDAHIESATAQEAPAPVPF